MNMYLEFSYTSENWHLEDAKRHLIELLVQKTQAMRQIRALKDRIAEYEGYANEALDKGHEALAQEISEKIAVMDADHIAQEESDSSFFQRITRVEDIVRQLEYKLKYPLSKDLERLQYHMDYLDAAAELEQGTDAIELERKMHAAGIGRRFDGGQEVLARIRSEREKNDA